MIFGIKLVIIRKINLTVNPTTMKFLKTKMKSCSDESTDFQDKEIP